MSGRVLITGASGLLGRAIFQEFDKAANWETLGLAFSRTKGKLQKVDLTQEAQVEKVLQDFKPNVVVHSAAERRPDVVENEEDYTQRLNVEATKTLAQQADKVGAIMVYISTDYVFDGRNPPFKTTDEPHPLNKYGESKLEGERIMQSVNKDNIILRLPILYGDAETLEESAVTVLFGKVMATDKDCVMSDYERRFPTRVADVAVVLRQLCERRLQDPSLTGVFHWSGDEDMTKYDMAVVMAEVFGLPTAHIKADKMPSGGTKRPYDAHLDPSRIENLGICHRMPFKEGIKTCLEPFFVSK